MGTGMYVVIGAVVLWFGLMVYMQRKARANEGSSAEPLYGVLPELGGSSEPALVYCFSARCGPCRSMTPEVEALQAQNPRVFKLDIGQHMPLAQQMGIRGTPTTLLIRDGQIARTVLGAKNRKALQALLEQA